MRRLLRLLLPAVMLVLAAPAHAQLTIEITRGVEAGIPIAIVPFEVRGGSAPEHDKASIIEANLQRSGRFDPVPRGNFMSRPSDHTQVQMREWRQLRADALVVGRIEPRGNEYSVQFQLLDVIRDQQLGGFRYSIPATQVRKLAHQISDFIYEQLTGEPGAFDTRIAYVTVEREDVDNARYLLQVADSDGFGPRTVLQSREPIMSPAWSPDGQRLAYVSFEERRPIVYVQRLADGQRQKVADSPGINSAPAFSPDGRRLALTLSRDGNPEIYVLDLETRAFTRLTNDLGIDTEPSWSPDGRQIVFTSDRSGRPQVYRIRADGSQLERLTFDGRYNARPSFSADGERLVLVTNQGSGFQIAQLHLRSGALQILTDRRNDESPSYAPNGRLIIYATEERGRGTLAVVSADGRVRQSLRFQEGDVREPAWSPLNPQL